MQKTIIKQTVRHEWRMLRGDPALWVAVSLLLALTIYAAYNGGKWRQLIENAPKQAQAKEKEEYTLIRQELADIASGKIKPTSEDEWGKPGYHRDVRDPYITGYYGNVVAALPPAPLLGLCIGQSDLNSSYYLINTRPRHELMTFAKTAEIENPLHLLIGNFDLSFVIVYLFPLFIIALMYNLISGEREAGTLALTLSMPVSLRQVVTGKLASRAGIFLALGLLLPGAAFWLSGSPRTEIPRLTLWCVVTMIYGAFWFALSLLIAVRKSSSANNAVALTACWLALVVIIPALITLAANVLYPVPSRAVMLQALRAAEREVDEDAHKAEMLEAFAAKFAALYPGDIRAAVKRREGVLTDYARRDAISARLTEIERRIDEAKAKQQRFARRLAVLSPALLTQLLFSVVAGSNAERFEQFANEVAAFHLNWHDYFTGKLLRGAQLTLTEINQLPRLVWTEETFGSLLIHLAPSLLLLLIVIACLFVLALRRLRCYPLTG